MPLITGMGKLRRQIIMLALCLTAVLIARIYVNDFVKTQRDGAQGGASTTVESFDRASPVTTTQGLSAAGETGGSASGITVETSAPAAQTADDTAAGDKATRAGAPSPMATGEAAR